MLDIWIEAEQWAPGEWDPMDCNSDVIVSFEKGAEWVATFFTYQNIQTLIEKNKHTGECLQGKYFWASEMILVEQVTRNRVEEIVEHLVAEGEFEKDLQNQRCVMLPGLTSPGADRNQRL